MTQVVTPDDLRRRFSVEGVTFEAGEGRLTQIVVKTPHGEARIYTHGAHVSHWQPAGHEPVMFMSRKSWFEPGKPIRGGVPVCFPWFGPGAPTEPQPKSPPHGFVRLRDWNVDAIQREADGSVTVTLKLTSDGQTRGFWAEDFAIVHRIHVGPAFSMTLEVTNTGRKPLKFEEALHTYFAVKDVRNVQVRGLENHEYFSKVEGGPGKQPGEPIRITSETDRIFHGTTATCVLEDPGLSRRIVVEKSNSQSTVVWNPWVAKAAAMPDFGDDEWPQMICIETANVWQHAPELPPGQAHAMTATLRVERM